MRPSHILLSLTLLLCTLKFINTQVYPDIPINALNSNDITCANAGSLVAPATNDKNRLTGYLATGGLSKAIENANQALNTQVQTCTSARLSLLQAQRSTRSKIGSASMLNLALANFEKQLSLEDDQNPFFNSFVVDKARETAQTLTKIREGATSGAEQGTFDLTAVCNDANGAIQSLVNYLNGLNKKIADIITSLNDRLNAITNYSNTYCVVLTQTGTSTRNYANNPTLSSKDNSANGRSDFFIVNYPKSFGETPSVGLALLGYELTQGNQLQLQVVSVYPDKFVMRVTVGVGVAISSVQFSWIATISPKSNIYIATAWASSTDDDVSKQLANANNRKVVSRPHGVSTSAIDVTKKGLAFINSFSYNPASTVFVRLDVNLIGSSVYFSWWDGSPFLSAGVTTIVWNADDRTIDYRYGSSSFLGPMTAPSISDRSDRALVDLSGYLAQPEIFHGLMIMDLNYYEGYRFRQDPNGNYPNLSWNFATWSKAWIGQLCDVFFLSCQTGEKRFCKAT